MKVSLPDIDWAKNSRTMLFVLSSSCKYCKDSAPFYQRLIRESKGINDIQMVALLPQETKESKEYLADIGLAIKDVRETTPSAVGVSGFPALLLVDNTGTIKKAWVGKLTEDKETEVLHLMKCANCI